MEMLPARVRPRDAWHLHPTDEVVPQTLTRPQALWWGASTMAIGGLLVAFWWVPVRRRAGLRHLHGLRQRPHLRRHSAAPGGLVGPDPRRPQRRCRLRAAEPVRHPHGPARRRVRTRRDLRPPRQPLQRPLPPAVVSPHLPLGRVGNCGGGDRGGRSVAVVGGPHRPAREPALPDRQPVAAAASGERSGRRAGVARRGRRRSIPNPPVCAVHGRWPPWPLPSWPFSWRSGWW